jgi:hypothetical protein
LEFTKPSIGTLSREKHSNKQCSLQLDAYWQANKPTIRRKCRGLLSKGVLLFHDSTRPHSAAQTAETLRKLKSDVMVHPPYSPDLATCSVHSEGQQGLSSHLWRKREGGGVCVACCSAENVLFWAFRHRLLWLRIFVILFSPSKQIIGSYLKLGHGLFHSLSFHLSIHYSSNHWTQCIPGYWADANNLWFLLCIQYRTTTPPPSPLRNEKPLVSMEDGQLLV